MGILAEKQGWSIVVYDLYDVRHMDCNFCLWVMVCISLPTKLVDSWSYGI